ncbi:hypothetical protein FSARC_4944 [Fusarium sarcochroum]|uniref:WSC domain-containing protein n=1 Tax=Fusarium sarcochroum TaxID=1208366 RepID=A0A8H4U0Q2_9HYPO|nr:hypothetical protein FSARC_4944 [Fusarium sarcochroum]
MKTSALATMVIATASFIGVQASSLQGPVVEPVLNQVSVQGCWKSNGNMTKEYSGTDTSSGDCTDRCKKKKNLVAATQGAVCYCGDLYPEEGDIVDDDKCNWPCPAYGKEACGALKTYYSVFNTGIELAPDNYVPEKSTTSAAPSSTTAAESTTAQESVAATYTEEPAATSEAPKEEKKDGPNVTAIAAGVVVGVVVIAAIGGGALFFVRRRRNAEIEEEHRRNAAVNAFINGSKPPGSSGSISMTDSRLDPVMAHRRLSDGSIADNQDYSRRILRVTNA